MKTNEQTEEGLLTEIRWQEVAAVSCGIFGAYWYIVGCNKQSDQKKGLILLLCILSTLMIPAILINYTQAYFSNEIVCPMEK